MSKTLTVKASITLDDKTYEVKTTTDTDDLGQLEIEILADSLVSEAAHLVSARLGSRGPNA